MQPSVSGLMPGLPHGAYSSYHGTVGPSDDAGASAPSTGTVLAGGMTAYAMDAAGGGGGIGGHWAPRLTPRTALSVDREDCLAFDGVVAASPLPTAGEALTPRRVRPSSSGAYGGQSSSRGSYSAFGQSPDATELHCSGRASRRKVQGSSAALRSRGGVTVAMLEATVFNPDVPSLLASESALDHDIAALLVAGERFRLSGIVIFFTCQGLLMGLSLLAATASRMKPALLAEALGILEPWMTSMSIALAEVALVGCILRMLSMLERAAASAVAASASSEDDVEAAGSGGQRDLQRRAWAQASFSVIGAMANFAVLICCLLSCSDGDSYGAAVWSATAPGSWKADGAKLLLSLRAWFALLAMAPVVLDMQCLVSPPLPAAALLRLLTTGTSGCGDGSFRAAGPAAKA